MRFVRGWFVLLLVGAAACSTRSEVHCTVQSDCDPFPMTLCTGGACHLGAKLDLGDDDLAGVFSDDDLAGSDQATGPADMIGSCSNDALSCPSSAPICGASLQCRACIAGDDAQCGGRAVTTPRCDTITGACATCRAASEADDCPSTALSVCGSDGSCRKACAKHSDCDSGICDPGIITPDRASCARADEVVYVEAQTTCPATANGSKTNPFCTFDAVLAKLPTGGYVYALPSTAGNLAQAKNGWNAPYVVVGTATITGVTTSAGGVTFYPSAFSVGAGGKVYLYGVTIQNAVSTGVTCDGGALTLSHVGILGSGAYAVSIGDCKTTIDATNIRGNGGGIGQSAGTLSVTNSFIVNNTGVGVSIGSGATIGQLAHLTVMYNKPAAAGAGAFACGAAANIYNSIVRGNQQSAASSFSGACSFHYSDVDETFLMSDHDYNLAPKFVGAKPYLPIFDYHLVAGDAANVSCCFDQGTTLASIVTDVDGNKRPLGAGYDIGADEVQ